MGSYKPLNAHDLLERDTAAFRKNYDRITASPSKTAPKSISAQPQSTKEMKRSFYNLYYMGHR